MTTSDPRPDAPNPPSTLGRFRVVDHLDQGGVGTVYRAVDETGRPAALKVLHSEAETAPTRFVREAHLRLDHPHVVRMIEADMAGDGPQYIAFELLQGESLRQSVHRRTLTPAEAVDLGVQVCRGLRAIHAAGVVHRDIKPENIFCCHDGTFKVLDFGIALQLAAARLTADGRLVGTPAYTSPEQAGGETDLDERSDLFSLSVVLYEAICGLSPFLRDGHVSTLLAVLEDPYPPVHEVAPDVPTDLAAVIERGMSKRREDRWSSAAAMEAALEQVGLERRPNSDTGSRRVVPALEEGPRVAAVLLATGVVDRKPIEGAITAEGGMFVPLPDGRAVGIFGSQSWLGLEPTQAVRAGLACRGAAAHISVATGRLDANRTTLSGAVIDVAEAGAALSCVGLAVERQTVQCLAATLPTRPLTQDFCEVWAELPDHWPLLPEFEPVATPTVGREVEMEALSGALDRLLGTGRGSALLVTGPPGIGKSRLRRDFEDIVEAKRESGRPVEVLAWRAEPRDRHASLRLVSGVLKNRIEVGALLDDWPELNEQDPPDRRRVALRHLAGQVIDDRDDADSCARGVAAALGAQTGTHPIPDSPAAADRIRASFVDFVEALAAKRPVVLLIEDLQWADDASIDVLEDIAARLAGAPCLVLATARPSFWDRRPGFGRNRSFVPVELAGLGAEHVADLAEAIISQPIAREVIERVARPAEGNPSLVEQLVLALQDDQMIDAPARELALPLSVEATILARLDELPDSERQLLRHVSVFRRAFCAGGAGALLEAEAGSLLESLVRRGLLVRRGTRGARDHTYGFASELVQQVAYRWFWPTIRRRIHGRAASYLAAQPRPCHEDVALHWERGGQPERAAGQFVEAALEASRQGDGEAVLSYSNRAFDLGLARPGPFALCMARADALGFLGRFREQGDALEAALATASSDEERARACIERSTWTMRVGRVAQAVAVARRSVDLADSAGIDDLRAFALGNLAVALAEAGKRLEARDVLKRAERRTRKDDAWMKGNMMTWRARVASVLGDLGYRQHAFARAAELFREAGDLRRAAGAETERAAGLNRLGDYDHARKALVGAADESERVGNRFMAAHARAGLGHALAMLGRTDESTRILDRVAAEAGAGRNQRLAIRAGLCRVRCRLAVAPTLGVIAEAEELAAAARVAGIESLEAAAYAAAAAALVDLGLPDRAVRLAGRSMAIRDRLGGIADDEGEIYLAYARSLASCGRSDLARGVAGQGRLRILQLAGRIGDERSRATFLDNIPANRALMYGLSLEPNQRSA